MRLLYIIFQNHGRWRMHDVQNVSGPFEEYTSPLPKTWIASNDLMCYDNIGWIVPPDE